MVARASGDDPATVAREAAAALAACAEDPMTLVTACRRLVDRQAPAGPVWWLAARVVTAADPEAEAWRAAEELHGDPTPGVLAAILPDNALLTVLGWPDQLIEALRRRGDVRVLAVDSLGDGSPLVRALDRAGTDASVVRPSAIGPAVAASTLVLLDASALGPGGFLAVTGSHAAAAVAHTEQIPVWAVAGVGRVLPDRLWRAAAARVADGDDEPWESDWDLVPIELASAVVGPQGRQSPADALGRAAGCPEAPELIGGPGG